jgi:hypothetical protein
MLDMVCLSLAFRKILNPLERRVYFSPEGVLDKRVLGMAHWRIETLLIGNQ